MDQEICLDSDVLIGLLRGYTDIKEKLSKIEPLTLCTTSVNIFELWSGREEKEKTLEFMGEYKIFDFDKDSAKIAGNIHKTLKKEGVQVEMRDLFIAVICIKNNLKLFTFNKKHFERLKRFGLILF